jgi:hypothetical protein
LASVTEDVDTVIDEDVALDDRAFCVFGTPTGVGGCMKCVTKNQAKTGIAIISEIVVMVSREDISF